METSEARSLIRCFRYVCTGFDGCSLIVKIRFLGREPTGSRYTVALIGVEQPGQNLLSWTKPQSVFQWVSNKGLSYSALTYRGEPSNDILDIARRSILIRNCYPKPIISRIRIYILLA